MSMDIGIAMAMLTDSYKDKAMVRNVITHDWWIMNTVRLEESYADILCCFTTWTCLNVVSILHVGDYS
jgi:hypothetical protein